MYTIGKRGGCVAETNERWMNMNPSSAYYKMAQDNIKHRFSWEQFIKIMSNETSLDGFLRFNENTEKIIDFGFQALQVCMDGGITDDACKNAIKTILVRTDMEERLLPEEQIRYSMLRNLYIDIFL